MCLCGAPLDHFNIKNFVPLQGDLMYFVAVTMLCLLSLCLWRRAMARWFNNNLPTLQLSCPSPSLHTLPYSRYSLPLASYPVSPVPPHPFYQPYMHMPYSYYLPTTSVLMFHEPAKLYPTPSDATYHTLSRQYVQPQRGCRFRIR